MIQEKSRNHYGYTTDAKGLRLMADDFAPLIVQDTTDGERVFHECLRVREVEEILMVCRRLSPNIHVFAKKLKKRMDDGSQHNGFIFWQESR